MIAAAELAGKMVRAVSSYRGDEKERMRQLAKTYQQIAKTCQLASGTSPVLQDLATQIGQSPIVEDIESFVGSEWLKLPPGKRNFDGVALVGKASGAGDQLELSSGKLVALVGQQSLPEADRLLVLGRIGQDGSIQSLLVHPLP
jgi:hypothetical protein